MTTVYVTAPPAAAPDIAETLVEEQVAACVNRVRCHSVYRWEGEVHDEEEVILLAKAPADRADELIRRVEEIHPYDVPCIERFEETDVPPSFGEWRSRVTGGDQDS